MFYILLAMMAHLQGKTSAKFSILARVSKNKLREFGIYSFKFRAKNHSLMQRDEIHIFQMHAAWHALGDFAHR